MRFRSNAQSAEAYRRTPKSLMQRTIKYISAYLKYEGRPPHPNPVVRVGHVYKKRLYKTSIVPSLSISWKLILYFPDDSTVRFLFSVLDSTVTADPYLPVQTFQRHSHSVTTSDQRSR